MVRRATYDEWTRSGSGNAISFAIYSTYVYDTRWLIEDLAAIVFACVGFGTLTYGIYLKKA